MSFADEEQAFFLGGPLHGEVRWLPRENDSCAVDDPLDISLLWEDSPKILNVNHIVYKRSLLWMPDRSIIRVFVCDDEPHKQTTELELVLWKKLRPAAREGASKS